MLSYLLVSQFVMPSVTINIKLINIVPMMTMITSITMIIVVLLGTSGRQVPSEQM